jgi:uncharacterized protein YdeI (YjbR/CyaY-like superfamily)
LAAAVRRPVFFESAAAFRQWLEQNSLSEQELVVGFYKVGTGKPSLSWSESVDEALCFGWIDGVRKRIDDHSYQIRFTPRKPGSVWSAVNIAKVEALTALGRVRPAGAEAFARRTARKSSVYSYEQAGVLELSPQEQRTFKGNKTAWQYFGRVAPSYRKVMVFWVVSAKQRATRARRLAQLIEACAEGRKLLK